MIHELGHTHSQLGMLINLTSIHIPDLIGVCVREIHVSLLFKTLLEVIELTDGQHKSPIRTRLVLQTHVSEDICRNSAGLTWDKWY